jgi:hypothetical protein
MVMVPADYEQSEEVKFMMGKSVCEHCVDLLKEDKKSVLIGSEKFSGVVWWDRKLQMFYCQVWVRGEHVETLLHFEFSWLMGYLQTFYAGD